MQKNNPDENVDFHRKDVASFFEPSIKEILDAIQIQCQAAIKPIKVYSKPSKICPLLSASHDTDDFFGWGIFGKPVALLEAREFASYTWARVVSIGQTSVCREAFPTDSNFIFRVF
jgi:hypothetical protein